MKNICLVIVLSLFLSGCAVKMYTYRSQFPPTVETADVAAAAEKALQANGFTVALLNEKTGVVTTDWKSEKSISKRALQTFMTRDAKVRRMKISVSVDKQSNVIKLNPVVEAKQSIGSWKVNKMYSSEEDITQKIMKEMLEKLDIDPSGIEIIKE